MTKRLHTTLGKIKEKNYTLCTLIFDKFWIIRSWYEKRQREHERRGQSAPANQRPGYNDPYANQGQEYVEEEESTNQRGGYNDPYANQRQPSTEAPTQEYRGRTRER